MKKHRGTIITLTLLSILTMGILAYVVYANGVRNQINNKQTAQDALKKAAELWVNREFDKMNIPHSSTGGEDLQWNIRRSMWSAKDTIIVIVDPLKEQLLLLPSKEMGGKATILYLLGDFSLHTYNAYWLEEMKDHQLQGYRCALQAEILGFAREGKPLHFIGGDSSLCVPSNLLGTYYLNDLYTIETKAYLQPPTPWQSANWNSPEVCATLLVVLLIGVILILYITHIYSKQPKLQSPIIQEKYIYQLSTDTYQIGKIEYNDRTGLITWKENASICPPQPHRLLSAFLFAPEHFLSNNEIAEICGWALDDTGIDSRRRSAIKALRKLLVTEETDIRIDSIKGKNGYQLFVIENP